MTTSLLSSIRDFLSLIFRLRPDWKRCSTKAGPFQAMGPAAAQVIENGEWSIMGA